MIKIKNVPIEELGDLVCKIINEELKEKVYFDYIECTEKEYLFRWVFEDETYKDFLLSDMIKTFKTLDSLIVFLLGELRGRRENKRA